MATETVPAMNQPMSDRGEPFIPENETFGTLGIADLQHHLTLLQWFKELVHEDKAEDSKFLLLAEQRYEAWTEVLGRLAHEPTKLPLPPIDVVYMWHAHMLSPFKYYEDVHYLGQYPQGAHKISLPLRKLHDAYNNHREADPSDQTEWVRLTGLPYKLDPTIHEHYMLRSTLINRGSGIPDQTIASKNHTIIFDGLTGTQALDRRQDWRKCQWKVIDASLNEVRRRTIRRRRWRAVTPKFLDNVTAAYREMMAPFSLDLCLAVLRQRSFTDTMCHIPWNNPESLGVAIKRYKCFMSLMCNFTKSAKVPTIDIDLVWHTHQLHPALYYDFCLRQTHRFIDHDDTIGKSRLEALFRDTALCWSRQYRQPYTIDALNDQYLSKTRVSVPPQCHYTK
ncbi:hypothetical protein IWQ60_010062 [Tieghemiomyces parasiticus]|uniref:Uncharacterized protein n=1 Tax=Tieghemiomyces parasiticus TaxID=78921 RepID=A0A9W7ZKY0_9FUNG|nr:hypothetical protein IWQ60_010062 [Tieghemiomyces parasiticus]